MYSAPITLPAGGLDQISNPLAMPDGYASRAENVVISRDGVIMRRPGRTLIQPGHDFHSIADTGHGLLIGKGSNLFRIANDPMAPEHIINLGTTGLIDFTSYNGHTYLTNGHGVWWMPASEHGARQCGVSLPDRLPAIAAHPDGALAPGMYAVALSVVDEHGEESPAAILGQIDLPAGGGILLTGVDGSNLDLTYRVYLTPPDGDALYLSESFSAAFSQYLVTRQPDGAIQATRDLERLPGGQFIRGMNGRLYVAAGDALWFSQAMRPHLCNRAHNYIRFVGGIRFIEPLMAGMMVADDRGVWLLEGADPTTATQRLISPAKAMAGSSIRVPATMTLRTQLPSAAVIWLSEDGYMVATDTGETEALNQKRVRVQVDGRSKTVITEHQGTIQLVTLIISSA